MCLVSHTTHSKVKDIKLAVVLIEFNFDLIPSRVLELRQQQFSPVGPMKQCHRSLGHWHKGEKSYARQLRSVVNHRAHTE